MVLFVSGIFNVSSGFYQTQNISLITSVHVFPEKSPLTSICSSKASRTHNPTEPGTESSPGINAGTFCCFPQHSGLHLAWNSDSLFIPAPISFVIHPCKEPLLWPPSIPCSTCLFGTGEQLKICYTFHPGVPVASVTLYKWLRTEGLSLISGLESQAINLSRTGSRCLAKSVSGSKNLDQQRLEKKFSFAKFGGLEKEFPLLSLVDPIWLWRYRLDHSSGVEGIAYFQLFLIWGGKALQYRYLR